MSKSIKYNFLLLLLIVSIFITACNTNEENINENIVNVDEHTPTNIENVIDLETKSIIEDSELKQTEVINEDKDKLESVIDEKNITDTKKYEDIIPNLSEIVKGNVVKFGRYEQDNDISNGAEPIEWVVLYVDKDAEKGLLLSNYILDGKPYNDDFEDVTWETCTLRKWLNNEFYDKAFTDNEKNIIMMTTLDNKDNSNGTPGGNFTDDMIFLLASDDVTNYDYGFSVNVDKRDRLRKCTATEYAKDEKKVISGGWWLRSVGKNNKEALLVTSDGRAAEFSKGVNFVYGAEDIQTKIIREARGETYYKEYKSSCGVRPALYISLKG